MSTREIFNDLLGPNRTDIVLYKKKVHFLLFDYYHLFAVKRIFYKIENEKKAFMSNITNLD